MHLVLCGQLQGVLPLVQPHVHVNGPVHQPCLHSRQLSSQQAATCTWQTLLHERAIRVCSWQDVGQHL